MLPGKHQRAGCGGLLDGDDGYRGHFLGGGVGFGHQGGLVAAMRDVTFQEADDDQGGYQQCQQREGAARGWRRCRRPGRGVLTGRGVFDQPLLFLYLALEIFDFGAQARLGIVGHLQSFSFARIVFHFKRCILRDRPGGLSY